VVSESRAATILLNQQWGFQLDPDGRGQQEGWSITGLPSKAEVTVPHTWNVDRTSEEFRGLGWYENRFQIIELDAGTRVWLHFEAVYRDTTIWINGQMAGTHTDSGYTAFRIEVTPFLIEGENLLIVAVNNSNSHTALPLSNSFDWADDGGIIRPVSIIVTGEAAIDYVQIEANPVLPTPDQPIPSGTINGCIILHNTLNTSIDQIELELVLQRGGSTVWSGIQKTTYTGQSITLSEITLNEIELWHFDYPNLYELQIRLLLNGKIQDKKTVLLGFREFRTEGSQFLLNGEPVRLVGVEWMPGSHPLTGMAESEEDRERVLKHLKNVNCVLTRFHWQQDDQLLEWCDKNGILVQEELPLWQKPAEPGDETLSVAKQQLFEMITRHNHHPSVIAWGVGNELNGQCEQTVAFVQKLKAYVLKLDRTRIVNYVSNTVHLEPAKDATGVGDVIMWNDYIGTWHGEHDMDEVIGKMVAAYPDKPIVVAEFGLCEPAFEGGDPKRIEILLEKTEAYRRYPNIAGTIFFSFNDYRTQMGEEGEGRLRQRVHGVTDVYGIEKPSYQLLRETASPLQLEVTKHSASDEIKCHLTCRNDLPSYSVTGYYLLVESNGGDSEAFYDIPDMKPGDTCEIVIPAKKLTGSVKLVVNRPTSFSILDRSIEMG
jgi:Beta-galactosidase/beta-glucuronidase